MKYNNAKNFFVPRIEAGLALSKLVSKLETGSRILDKNDPPLAGFVRNPALLGRVSKTSVDTPQDALRQSIDNLKRKGILSCLIGTGFNGEINAQDSVFFRLRRAQSSRFFGASFLFLFYLDPGSTRFSILDS